MCTERIGIWLHLGSGSNVRVTARLSCSVTVWHGKFDGDGRGLVDEPGLEVRLGFLYGIRSG